MRFDYTGIGDSEGAVDATCIDTWCDDVLSAADELLSRCGAREIHVVGVRLGASLAAAALERASRKKARPVKTLIVWDPLLSGKAFLELATRFQRQYLRDPFRFLDDVVKRRGDKPPDDLLLGYAFADETRRALEKLDLGRVEAWPTLPLVAVLSEPTPAWQSLAKVIAGAGRPVESEVVAGFEGSWEDYAKHEKTLRAGPVTSRIVERLAAIRS